MNINLDFALFRCKPAQEFLSVGSALTVRRRQKPRQAQRTEPPASLDSLTPQSSSKPTGCRVSEILSHPGIHPQGTESNGPFQSFVGADCTSIWAAATSWPRRRQCHPWRRAGVSRDLTTRFHDDTKNEVGEGGLGGMFTRSVLDDSEHEVPANDFSLPLS